MFDFKSVFLPMFYPCIIQPFNFFFCYKSFTSLAFRSIFEAVSVPTLLPLCLPQSLYQYNMCPGRFFGEPTYYGHHPEDDTDIKAFPLIVRVNQVLLQFLFKKFFFFTHPFFQTFVIMKSELTLDHNVVKFSTRFSRLGLVLRWIHNTLTML